MILTQYILQRIFKNQFIIITLLLCVCLCQKFIKISSLLVDKSISLISIFIYLFLSIPEIGKLLIPFSLFLSVLVTFSQLHTHNEIIAIYSCVVNKYFLIRTVLYYNMIILVFLLINISWLSPYCTYYQSELAYKIKENFDLGVFSVNKFLFLNNKNIILFIRGIQDNKFKDIFIIKKGMINDSEEWMVIHADRGSVDQKFFGHYLLTVEQGELYKFFSGKKLYEDLYTTIFDRYQIFFEYAPAMEHKKDKLIYHMSMYQLWNSVDFTSRMELHWRLTLLISIFPMSVIAVSLMTIKLMYRYIVHWGSAILLYIFFFLLHILCRCYFATDQGIFLIYMWLINVLYFVVAGVLGIWNIFYIKRYWKSYIALCK